MLNSEFLLRRTATLKPLKLNGSQFLQPGPKIKEKDFTVGDRGVCGRVSGKHSLNLWATRFCWYMAKSMRTRQPHLTFLPTPPERTFGLVVCGHSAAEAHLVELAADRPGAHSGPRGGLKLGGERLHRGQTLLQRHSLQHLAVLLLELVRSAAPGQSRRYSSAFPLEDHRAHGGAGQVEQRGNLTHGLFTQVASNNGAPLKVTELLTATHSLSAVCRLHTALISVLLFSPFFFFGFWPSKCYQAYYCPPQEIYITTIIIHWIAVESLTTTTAVIINTIQ